MPDKDGISSEVSIGITFASFMSAVTLFFTGILIASYSSFNSTIKIPLIYLIISTFSFIFAASIYLNAATEITLNRLKIVEKYLIYSKNIVELLGLYLFVLATPMVIGAVTKDSFLRTVTILVTLIGFLLYSQSRFSTLAKELTRTNKRAFSFFIVILALCLYLAQLSANHGNALLYNSIAIVLLALITSLTVYFSLQSKQYKPTFFRPFKSSDAKTLSDIALKNISHLKNRNHSEKLLENMRAKATPAALRKLAKDYKVYVAEFDNKIVGMACIDKHQITQIFTDPSFQRKGIGHMLVDYVEHEIAKQGYEYSEVEATAADHIFYEKLGYDYVKQKDNSAHQIFVMRKELHY